MKAHVSSVRASMRCRLAAPQLIGNSRRAGSLQVLRFREKPSDEPSTSSPLSPNQQADATAGEPQGPLIPSPPIFLRPDAQSPPLPHQAASYHGTDLVDHTNPSYRARVPSHHPPTSSSTPINVPGPYDSTTLGVTVPRPVSWLLGTLSLGWLAAAVAFVATPNTAMRFLSVSEALVSGSGPLLFWGASLFSLAGATWALKEACDADMIGSLGSDLVNAAVLVGNSLTLMVVVEAAVVATTRDNRLYGLLGGWSLVGVLVSTWLSAHGHRGKAVPALLNLGAMIRGVLACFPSFPESWAGRLFMGAQWAYTGLGVGLVVPASRMMLLPTNIPQHMVVSLGVPVWAATGAGLVATGLLCGFLSRAADRHVLHLRPATAVSGAIALSSLLAAGACGLALWFNSPYLALNVYVPLATMCGLHTLGGLLAAAAHYAPGVMQGGKSFVLHPGLPSDMAYHATAEGAEVHGHSSMSLNSDWDPRFWAVMSQPMASRHS